MWQNYSFISKLQRLHRRFFGMNDYFHPTLCNGCNYLSMLGLKVNHVSERGPRIQSVKLLLTHIPQCHIYESVDEVSFGSSDGMSPFQRQAITWTKADLLSIGPLGIIFSEIRIRIKHFSFMKMQAKMSSAICRPFCRGRDEVILFLWQLFLWITGHKGYCIFFYNVHNTF